MALAAKLPATVRGLLIDQVDPLTISVDSLLKDLRVDPERHLLGELSAHVMSIRSALPDGACETLRAAVDDESNRSVKKDSVDGGSAHELVLDLASLTALIGHAAARELCLLPARYAEWQRHPRPLVPAVPAEIFVRRYSSDTRPWINFHADAYSTTINIALDSSTTHEGGSLVAVADGKGETIERQGEATVHDSRLLHAVTSIRGARIRHSLILFFGQRRRREENETAEQEEEEEASRHSQTIPWNVHAWHFPPPPTPSTPRAELRWTWVSRLDGRTDARLQTSSSRCCRMPIVCLTRLSWRSNGHAGATGSGTRGRLLPQTLAMGGPRRYGSVV